MLRTRLALLALALACGCASAPPAGPERPFRFAVLPAPALGAPGALERLYAALDLLSARGEALDLCLVPGPLLAGEEEGLETELAQVLGSLPAPVVVAFAPGDAPRRAALLQALEEAFQPQPAARRARGGWEPVPLGADGSPEAGPAAPPGGEPARRLWLAAAGVTPGAGAGAALTVEVGQGPLLEAGEGGPRLVLAPLGEAPHVLAVGTVLAGELSVSLLALQGEPPPGLGPLRLP